MLKAFLLFSFCISFVYLKDQWIKNEHKIAVSGFTNDIIIFSQFYRTNICFPQQEVSQRVLLIEGNYTKIVVENEHVYFRYFTDKNCTNEYESYWNGKIDVDYPSNYFASGPGYEAKRTWMESEEPEIPEGKEGTYVKINVYDDKECKDDYVAQRFFVNSHQCNRNWVAYGNYNNLDDMVYMACDQDYLYTKVFKDINCEEEGVIYITYFNLGLIKYAEQLFPDFNFCFKHTYLQKHINFECTNEKEPEFVPFKSEAKYMRHDLYYKNDEMKCLGVPTLKTTYTLDKCSGGQIINSNQSLFVIRVYSEDDENCEERPNSVLFHDMKASSSNEEDPFCYDVWISKQENYFRKQIFFNEYDLKDYSSYIAMVPNVDCNSIDKDYIIKYKYDPVRAFYYLYDDFCFSEETMFTYKQQDISFKGYCKDGMLNLKRYTNSNCEKNFFEYLGTQENNNSFCTDPFYLTCLSYICFGKESFEKDICSGHGTCINFDTCECDDGYTGFNCGEVAVSTFLLILVPFTISLLIIIIVLIFVSIIIVLIILLKIQNQKKKIDEFADIEDIDILVQESKLEKKEGTASFKPKSRTKKEIESFEIKMESITLKKEIGEGGSGSKIFLALWESKEVAFKIFKSSFFTEQKVYDEFNRELQFAMNLSHPSILQFYGACFEEPKIGIVMEYCPNSTLIDFIRQKTHKNKKLDVVEKIRLLIEICSGMEYLKNKNIIHRDLKPDNILIDKAEHPKIIDFGLSKLKKNADQTMTKQIGTSFYMSPELINDSHYTWKVDVYSFGILAWECYYETNPYGEDAYSIRGLELKVSKDPKFRPKIEIEDEFKYPEFFEVIKNAWNHLPDERNDWKTIQERLKDIKELTKITEKEIPKIEKDKKEDELKEIYRRLNELYSRKEKYYDEKIKSIEKIESRI